MVAGLAGCSTTGNQTTTANANGGKLTVYASVPSGTEGQDMFDAEQLALKQGGSSAGKFTIVLRQTKLPADTVKAITTDVRQADTDQSTIAYLGEVIPGTSDQSIPITNELGILQVSPTDNALELTQASPILPDSRKNLFFPSESTYGYTFARMVPSGAKEASAIVAEMAALHVSKLYVTSDGLPCTKTDISGCYGKAIAHAVLVDAPSKSIAVQTSPTGADAAFVGSNSAARAVTLFQSLGSANPQLKLFGPAGLDTDAFASELPSAEQANTYISAPGVVKLSDLPSAASFQSAFTSAYGHAPAPQAVFGYVAMGAVLDAIHQAGASADNRTTVGSNFFALRNRPSALGTFTIDNAGDIELPQPTIVFNRFRGGQLEPFKAVPPTG